ncbi:polysaccharide deacetylase family protein [Sediminibacterium ginsengisoli]|uniref:Poly-beta-1,6 N-acetyl-D-glucosamine synthase n=1 Tax=Sediminibacterium ginsengisoli TaxID=413434 RepID=A0A1T4M2H8_9BACT|nr:polysaccharide deacetylase family protein [Sediminibacterium ginsengisoli]SJZ61131.1 poly-beta-1,6 N-acetyl-D-glucosamine synthase [Sediminibacterium ginsengisoli]
MSIHNEQIFQTSNPSRWQRVKWGSRILLFLLVVSIAAFIIAYITLGVQKLPSFEDQARKKVLLSEKTNVPQAKQYQGIRKFIDDRWRRGKGSGQHDSVLNLSNSPYFSDSLGIRAAFYVNWDPQSLISLRRHVNKLNLVIPEWFFLNPSGDSLETRIDQSAYGIMKNAGVKIMPLLTNNYNAAWRGDVVHRILNNPAKKTKLINALLDVCKRYGFAGVNIDFEALIEEKNEALTAFQKELYERLHAAGLLVSQDVSPFNTDYDHAALAKYNDYIFLMAYDEHSSGSKPGPVSSQRWVEKALDHVASKVPPEKIVLCMAGYGYDWVAGGQTTTLSYDKALTVARESEGHVRFSNETFNLSYQYYDEVNDLHEVHFTDAVSNFNTVRYATEYGLAGTSLWRLGSEDLRLWKFYNQPMTKKALRSFDFTQLTKIDGSNSIDYIGEGEVMNVVSLPRKGHITPELDTSSMLITEERYDSLPSMFLVKQMAPPEGKKMVLTFDDGPDPEYTGKVLDILAKYKVPAVFFLIGIEAEKNIPLVKRIYREGHELGNHTFTHPNIARVSNQRASLEIDATRLLLECITGHGTVLFRAPYSDADNTRPGEMEALMPISLRRTEDYLTIGENIDPKDWQIGEDHPLNADSIFNRVVKMKDSGNIILLHDAGGNRLATMEALPRIITYLQKNGYRFTSIADLLGKKKDEIMPPVPQKDLMQLNYLLMEGGYYGSRILAGLFIVFLLLGTIRMLILLVLATLQHRREKKLRFETGEYPLVSIIVPAYNEEVNAVSSLHNLLKCDYPDFNIIFVDDGSKDATYEKVYAAFKEHPKVRVLSKPNGGKASALNYGIAQTNAGFVVCIDADTKLKPDAVSKMMRHFAGNAETGAVAGNVKVGNEVNLLTRWQNIEYISSQGIDRKAFAWFNAITVVPGAIGAFRKEALLMAGGFTTDTLAEDCDLTIRILRCGYRVVNENDAVALTEAPETLKQFMKQRFRWTFGVMQTFWKNRDALFNVKYPRIGWIVLPDILLFKYIIPLFAPFADLMMLIGLFTGNAAEIGIYYLLFMLVDIAVAILAFSFEKEKAGKLVWLIPQRIVYRWLLLVVLFRAMRKAVKGELQHWGVLKRTGNVKEVVAGN